MNSLVYVAKIGKTHGLHGFLRLHNKSDFYEQFRAKSVFYDKDKNKYIIKEFDEYNSLVCFVGYEDLNSAKRLVNLELFSSIEDTRKNIKLLKNEYFYFDIIGLEVYENDELLGEVVDILETGVSHLLEIKTSANLVEKSFAKSFYIPYHDNFVLEVGEKIIAKNSKVILENS